MADMLVTEEDLMNRFVAEGPAIFLKEIRRLQNALSEETLKREKVEQDLGDHKAYIGGLREACESLRNDKARATADYYEVCARLSSSVEYAGECYRALLLMSGCFDDEGNLDERFRDQLSVAMEAMETALDKGAALSKNTIESGDEEVRSLAAGGAQLTQGGGDAAGMPLSVGRSRPDQTATYPSTSPPVSAETSALATPNTLAGGGTIYESVGFQYRFPSPWGGYTWRDSDTRYNGHDCHGAREIFVIVKEGKAVNGVLPQSPSGNYIQPVPDHCDRITWRGRYYHLPELTVELPQSARVTDPAADPPGRADQA